MYSIMSVYYNNYYTFKIVLQDAVVKSLLMSMQFIWPQYDG